MPFSRLAAATTPTCHIGLGLAAVGRPGYINLGREEDLGDDRSADALRARTHELLDAACPGAVDPPEPRSPSHPLSWGVATTSRTSAADHPGTQASGGCGHGRQGPRWSP